MLSPLGDIGKAELEYIIFVITDGEILAKRKSNKTRRCAKCKGDKATYRMYDLRWRLWQGNLKDDMTSKEGSN